MPYRIGAAYFDEVHAELRHGAETIVLGRQAAALLQLLAQRPGRLTTYPEIRERLWGDVHVGHNSIPQCVRKLRHALGDSEDHPALEVVYGQGVRLLLLVSDLSSAASFDVRRDGPAIMILPLDARDPKLLELGDRVAEELSTALSLPCNVLDYSLSRALHGIVWDPRELGANYGLQCVIVGRLEARGAELRARLRIVAAATRRTLGLVEASGSASALDQLVFALSARLMAKLMDLVGRMERSGDPTEYERMLLSHRRIWELSREQTDLARMELDELTRGDVVPREIHLHRTLSYLYDYWLPPVEMREGALAAIESCIESDGATAGNLSLLGNVRSLRGEHGAAQAAIEFSSVPQPDRYMVAFMHSFALLGMGRTEESICRAEESLALVPHHQVSFHVWQLLGRGHALRGDWDSAIRCAERSRMLKPTFPEACFDLALSYAYSGQKQRGQQVLADLGRHMNVKMLCATRPARGQAWEGWQRDGLARLGVGAL